MAEPKKRADMSPYERGYRSVHLSEELQFRLARQATARGIPNKKVGRRDPDYLAVIAALVADVESPPWERIRAALVAGLPCVRPDAIDDALHSVGMPKKEGV